MENEGPGHRQGQRGRVPQPGPAAGRKQGEAGKQTELCRVMTGAGGLCGSSGGGMDTKQPR